MELTFIRADEIEGVHRKDSEILKAMNADRIKFRNYILDNITLISYIVGIKKRKMSCPQKKSTTALLR